RWMSARGWAERRPFCPDSAAPRTVRRRSPRCLRRGAHGSKSGSGPFRAAARRFPGGSCVFAPFILFAFGQTLFFLDAVEDVENMGAVGDGIVGLENELRRIA